MSWIYTFCFLTTLNIEQPKYKSTEKVKHAERKYSQFKFRIVNSA